MSMSSKFFTWTKGDRKYDTEHLAVRGTLSIQADRISIDGWEFGPKAVKRGNKPKRRPLPLEMEVVHRPTSRHSSRTNDSFALQDAAVKSATCLMAAVTDMLQTPQVSAHLSAQQQFGFLSPVATCPRSHTAPSTPRAEIAHPDVAELPGSFPLDLMTPPPKHAMFADSRQMEDANNLFLPIPRNGKTRPQSVPFEPTPPGSVKKIPSKSTLCSASPTTRGRTKSVSADCDPLEIKQAWTRRPALRILQDDPWSDRKTPIQRCACHQEDGMPHEHYSNLKINSPNERGDAVMSAAEHDLMDRIVNIRASHEAHVCSLKAAHERELISHRSYIDLLERPRYNGISAQLTPKLRQNLTIDTSRPQPMLQEAYSSNASATTLVTFESRVESSSRLSEDSTLDAEIQLRDPGTAQKFGRDSEEYTRDCDQLRNSIGRRDRKITHLKEMLKKSKDNESALKNAVADLEARLEASNTERADISEGLHEATQALARLSQEEVMKKEMVEFRAKSQAQTSDASTNTVGGGPCHDGCGRAGHDADQPSQVEAERVKELEKELQQKSDLIVELEKVSMSVKEAEAVLCRVTELEASLKESQDTIIKTQADCDRYNSLYHNEVRRKNRGNTIFTPDLSLAPHDINSDKTVAGFGDQQQNQKPDTADGGADKGANPLPIQLLTRERQVKSQEKISYKAYTPPQYRASTLGVTHEGRPRRASFNHVTSSSTSGLGISGVSESVPSHHQRQHAATFPSPNSALTHMTHAQKLAPEKARRIVASMSDLKSKELPRLPVDALTASVTDCGESVRSLSDSIIASYAARGSPPAIPWAASPPLSKFAKSQLSTLPAPLCNSSLLVHSSQNMKDVRA